MYVCGSVGRSTPTGTGRWRHNFPSDACLDLRKGMVTMELMTLWYGISYMCVCIVARC